MNTAADAEEISEELVDIENFLRHHPEHRLPRIKELAQSLTDKNILPPSVIQDAEKLDARWRDLSSKAKLRTTILEGILLEQIPIYSSCVPRKRAPLWDIGRRHRFREIRSEF